MGNFITMRYFLIPVILSYSCLAIGQVNKYYPLHLSLSMGVIRHEFSTTSENDRIQGVPSFDYAPELSFNYNFNNKNVSISGGAQLISFTNIYKTNSSQTNEFDGKSRTIIGGTGYLKMFINYNYHMKVSDKFYLVGFIGPSLNSHRTYGEYDYYQSYFQEIENNQVIKTVIVNYKTERIKKQSFSSQMGISIQYKFSKGRILHFNTLYNYGFNKFNKTTILLNINGNQADQGIIYSKGNGISLSLGLSMPLNL